MAGIVGCVGLVGAAVAQGLPQEPHGSVKSRGVIIIQADPAASKPAEPQTAPTITPNGAIDSSRPVPKPAPPPQPAPAPVIKACDRPFAHPDLRLDDPAPFRAALATALRAGRIVVVDLATPYHADKAPPEALAPWLTEVRGSGGAVTTAAYCQQGRDAFGGFLARLFGGGGDPGRPYRAARRYDAVLHLDALDRVVTQVEFRPRSARPS